eukprot:364861-Chlamydomonas_euryale.AAC.23
MDVANQHATLVRSAGPGSRQRAAGHGVQPGRAQRPAQRHERPKQRALMPPDLGAEHPQGEPTRQNVRAHQKRAGREQADQGAEVRNGGGDCERVARNKRRRRQPRGAPVLAAVAS